MTSFSEEYPVEVAYNNTWDYIIIVHTEYTLLYTKTSVPYITPLVMAEGLFHRRSGV